MKDDPIVREFFWAYLKKVALLGPFVALLVLIPPAPASAKITGIVAFLIVMFFAQILELIVVHRNSRKGREPDRSFVDADDTTVAADEDHPSGSVNETRRSRRLDR